MPSSAVLGQDELAAGLRALGLRRGQDLLIHCSMRSIGHITGGPATLLSAITEVAGPDATVVVPTQTPLYSDTSHRFRTVTAGMSPLQYDRFMASLPGFDPLTSPSDGMGRLAEHVRTHPEARRSHHPVTSFAALGPHADACTAVHDLDSQLGDRSPLGWLYDAGAAIVLLGVGYHACTAFHLAEYRAPGLQRSRRYRCLIARNGAREPCEFDGIELDASDFEKLGTALESACEASGAASGPSPGHVGAADCRLVPMRAAVDFAVTWLAAHRR